MGNRPSRRLRSGRQKSVWSAIAWLLLIGMVADGMSSQEIVAAYPDLELEDVHEALRYAAEAVRERELPLAG